MTATHRVEIDVRMANRRNPGMVYRIGDVLTAARQGPTIIVFMVNDVTPTWGGGVARQAARLYPSAQASFRKRCSELDDALTLGSVALIPVDRETWLAPIVAQKGVGASAVARIRYAALRTALRGVAKFASTKKARIRMPRIGSGSARGRWARVAKTITAVIGGIPVDVFDLKRPHNSIGIRAALARTHS